MFHTAEYYCPVDLKKKKKKSFHILFYLKPKEEIEFECKNLER